MMTSLQGQHLPEWLAAVEADDQPQLHSFATGIRQDLQAITLITTAITTAIAYANGESRDYHLRVRVPPGVVGQEMLAARVRLVYGSAAERREADAGLVRAVWTAVVGADLLYYENVINVGGDDAARVPFPGYCTERRFRLTGTEMRIGRRSASRGLEPEIDLTGPPTDPGVSRLHAVLIAGPDGDWAILDPGSENGTLLNDHEIATGVPVPLGSWLAVMGPGRAHLHR
jgi:hypothetical protein